MSLASNEKPFAVIRFYVDFSKREIWSQFVRLLHTVGLQSMPERKGFQNIDVVFRAFLD